MTDRNKHDNRYGVLFVCDLIAPGGGPPGYTYNLRAPLLDMELSDLDVRFEGVVTEERHRGTGEQPAEPGTGPTTGEAGLARMVEGARRAAGRARHKVGLAMKHGVTTRLSEAMDVADLIVFQGFQDPRRMRLAKKRGKRVWYMPHSPTIAADDYLVMSPGQPKRARARKAAWIRRSERKMFRDADLLVFASRNASSAYVEAFGRFVNRTPVRYVMSGVPVPQPSDDRSTAPSSDDRAILFVGRYVSHKGYDLFLKAAESLKTSYPDLPFHTLGGGPGRRESAAVTDLGWLDDPGDVIENARFLVIPNRIAYFDLLPLEAAARGKGMVFTAVGGNIDQHHLLPDSVLCNVDELTFGIVRAIELSEDDCEWGSANRGAFVDRFTNERMAERWLSVIRNELIAPVGQGTSDLEGKHG